MAPDEEPRRGDMQSLPWTIIMPPSGAYRRGASVFQGLKPLAIQCRLGQRR